MSAGSGVEWEQLVDLREAIVWLPENASAAERRAAEMLSSEIKRRTRFLLPISTRLLSGRPHIIVCSLDKLPNLDIRIKQRLEAIESPEGFVVEVNDDQRERPLVFACGRTPRATLFVVGRLLRTLKMRRDFLAVEKGLSIVAEPHYSLRGHQLGYRPKTNSYDGWDLDIWEQYIRDLVAYGCNAVELIPPRSDDAPDSPRPMRFHPRQAKLAVALQRE